MRGIVISVDVTFFFLFSVFFLLCLSNLRSRGYFFFEGVDDVTDPKTAPPCFHVNAVWPCHGTLLGTSDCLTEKVPFSYSPFLGNSTE